MIRTVFIIVVVIHGLIHLLGFTKAFGFAELPQLTHPISRRLGLLWLAAAILLVATMAALVVWPRWWWLPGALALIVSQGIIALSWGDAKVGTLVNLVLLVGVLYGFASRGPLSLGAKYERHLDQVRRVALSPMLTEADLAPLPEPVRRYVRVAGALGRPRIRNFCATWKGRIRSSATSPWMDFTAEQLNTVDPPRRFFKMDAVMKGLPVDVLHAFDEGGATMRVRLLSAITMVDLKGPDLTRAETVTLFNDLCVLAPGALVSPLIAWEPVDATTARAQFTLRENTINAELRFNAAGELVDFVSDDRAAGTFKPSSRYSGSPGGIV
ncbi:MAG: hypothetical protein Q8K67_12365 [Geothrix sp.]|nr:hypothetical protein [Geothrix sp.]